MNKLLRKKSGFTLIELM
ncbi:MAG: prepilin-type N-terminal cleavage/methylation domain-containing protein, partial [Myxococcales bacterium]|nr:prepilin-type N-terminal cleavage/methylation domain-containing protein [Myxococcales bacterium]